MAHQVFANEGAGLLYTQNVSFEYPCAPTNLSRLFRYVSEGIIAADASGNLVLPAVYEMYIVRQRYDTYRGVAAVQEALEGTV